MNIVIQAQVYIFKLAFLKEFTVPLPYALLHVGSWIASSPLLWKLVNSTFIQKNMDEKAKTFIPMSIDRKAFRLLLKEIKGYRGLTIIDVKDKDGTEVVVRLSIMQERCNRGTVSCFKTVPLFYFALYIFLSLTLRSFRFHCRKVNLFCSSYSICITSIIF